MTTVFINRKNWDTGDLSTQGENIDRERRRWPLVHNREMHPPSLALAVTFVNLESFPRLVH